MLPLRQRLGRTVRRLRLAAGYSQEAFADHVGVHRTYMGAVERGEVNISLDNIERLAGKLGMTAGQLLSSADDNAGVPAEQRNSPQPPRPPR